VSQIQQHKKTISYEMITFPLDLVKQLPIPRKTFHCKVLCMLNPCVKWNGSEIRILVSRDDVVMRPAVHRELVAVLGSDVIAYSVGTIYL
jgi:hypothetical protein